MSKKDYIKKIKKPIKRIHRIGKHGAVGLLTNHDGRIFRVCCECGKEIKDKEDDVGYHSLGSFF